MPPIETREVERKYVAPAQPAVPDLSAVPGIERVHRRAAVDLVAQYFDTEDLALLTERITLRRRSGGPDEGWHLKLPAGTARRELRSPLTADDDVPDELLLLVAAVLRGRPLMPVMRLLTQRTVHEAIGAVGSLLAEVCDDRVSTEPGLPGIAARDWREWEVELVTGDETLLDRIEPYLLDAGAKPEAGPAKVATAFAGHLPDPPQPPQPGDPPSVGDVLHSYWYAESRRLLGNDPGARLHDGDAVHQMRVAARRLRSVLSAYRDLLPAGTADPLRNELKALAEALGGPRDAEVTAHLLIRVLDEQPPDEVNPATRDRLSAELDARYRTAHAAAMEFLTSERYYALLESLARLPSASLDDAADRPASEDLVRYFDRDWRRMRRTARRAAELPEGPEREVELHEVRKAAKRLRYGMESVSALSTHERAKQVAKAAEAITEILGAHNDAVVAAEVIGDIAAQAEARGEDTRTHGWIETALHTEDRRPYAAYEQALHKLNDVRLPGWAKI